MMDAIAGAFATLKGAADITQGLLSLKTDTAVSTKVVELNRVIAEVQSQLFAAQADYATVLGRVRDLEAQIVKLEHWAHEKERYQLHELVPGTLVYRIKPAMQGAEPVHDLCPSCYQGGVKSILQAAGVKEGCHAFRCPHPQCGAVFLGKRIDAMPYSAPRRGDYRGF